MASDKKRKSTAAKAGTKTKTSRKAKRETFDVNIRNVTLTKECRKRLKKVRDCLWGSVADAIECGNWWIPVSNHDYDHMKEEFEKGTKDFFNLEQDVCVKDFDTDIVSYNR